MALRLPELVLRDKGEAAEAADDAKDVVVGREHLDRTVIRVGRTVFG